MISGRFQSFLGTLSGRGRVCRLSVVNRAGSVLDRKQEVMARLVAREAKAWRCSIGPAGLASEPRLDAKFRTLGALGGGCFLLSLETFFSELVDPSQRDPEKLRVAATLGVEASELDPVSGEISDRRLFAVSRRTSPVVAGTQVGSRVVDALLGEIAIHVVAHWGATRFIGDAAPRRTLADCCQPGSRRFLRSGG